LISATLASPEDGALGSLFVSRGLRLLLALAAESDADEEDTSMLENIGQHLMEPEEEAGEIEEEEEEEEEEEGEAVAEETEEEHRAAAQQSMKERKQAREQDDLEFPDEVRANTLSRA
jgi:cysteinyl-tRNA synthetase